MSVTEQPKLTEIQRMAREAAERSRREQGLPPRVTDPGTIEHVAAILRVEQEATSGARLSRSA